MTDYKQVQNYLNAKAAASDATADKLDRIADLIPNHKLITRRLCVEDTYISEYYSKEFRVPVIAVEWKEYRHRDDETYYSEKNSTESVFLHDGQGRLPESTVASLKEELHNVARIRREEAKKLRSAALTTESRHERYLAAVEEYNAARDGLIYAERDAYRVQHLTN